MKPRTLVIAGIVILVIVIIIVVASKKSTTVVVTQPANSTSGTINTVGDIINKIKSIFS